MHIRTFVLFVVIGFLLTPMSLTAHSTGISGIAKPFQSLDCYSFSSTESQCTSSEQNDPCRINYYSEMSIAGDGFSKVKFINVDCTGTCGIVYGVMSSELNTLACCDQDHDDHNRTGSTCGGDDCNDNPSNNGANAYPGHAEWCGDGIDNDCDGLIDLNDDDCWCPEMCIPYYPPESGFCATDVDYCRWASGCPFPQFDDGQGCCCNPTPIAIDVNSNGYQLTDAINGVPNVRLI